jgi:hypothetical protein
MVVGEARRWGAIKACGARWGGGVWVRQRALNVVLVEGRGSGAGVARTPGWLGRSDGHGGELAG